MIFHENRLLADNSHVISCLIFVEKLGKILQNLSSAAVVIGALRVNLFAANQCRSGPTKCQVRSGSKLFDTLMVFLKEYIENFN